MSSLENGLRILQCFSEDRPSIGVSTIASELSLPKSSASRLMKIMNEGGLLEQDEQRQYSPGALLFRLGNLYHRRLRVFDLVDKALSELVAQFGLTGYIGTLNGPDVVIIQVRQGTYPVRLVLDKGYRVPAFATAMGLAMLARRTDAELRLLHARNLRYDETDLRMTVDELIRRLGPVRARGYAEVSQTTFRGFSAIACAVESAAERQVLGFSLSFPSTAYDSNRRRLIARAISQAARQIAAKTGDQFLEGCADPAAAHRQREAPARGRGIVVAGARG